MPAFKDLSSLRFSYKNIHSWHDRKELGRIKGFTLVEILVSISIMTVLFALGVTRYREFSRRQGLVNEVKNIISTITKTQNLASSGYKPTGCTGELLGIRYVMDTNNTYTIRAQCSVGSPIIEGPLPYGANFDVNPAVASILFFPVGQGTNLSADTVIEVVNLIDSRSAEITVTKEGSMTFEIL